MLKKNVLLAAAGLLTCLSLNVYAAKGGQGNTHMGGMATDHMSTQGMANTNGQNAATREQGLDRSGERRNAAGTEHGGFDRPHGKGKQGGMGHKTKSH